MYLPFTVTMGLHLTNNPGLPECIFNTMFKRFNTLFNIFTLDIKQCPRYMSLKNSLVETFSNNFPKLINNSSSLNSVNHKCDGVCISDINRPRSIYQYSNMAPRLSGQTSIFGVVFFVSKSP